MGNWLSDVKDWFLGSDKTATTKTNTSPWGPQQPYLKAGFKGAESYLKGKGPQYYKGSTVAGFSPEQTQSQRLGAERALAGSPLVDSAQGYAGDVLGGKYLNSFDKNGALFNSISSRVMPAVNSQFLASGRYGSGAQAGQLASGLTNAYAPVAAQGYMAERGLQQGAAGMAPELAMQDWTDLAALDAIGGQKQQLAQKEINDARQRWDFYQNQPLEKLKNYGALIGGDYGGVTTSNQPYSEPGFLQKALGIGLMGASTAGDLGWRPFG